MLRGAGDASFVAPYVDTLSGMGANGAGSHAPGGVGKSGPIAAADQARGPAHLRFNERAQALEDPIYFPTDSR